MESNKMMVKKSSKKKTPYQNNRLHISTRTDIQSSSAAQTKWYQNFSAIGAVSAFAAALIAGIALIPSLKTLFEPEPSEINIQIVVDLSSSASSLFPGETAKEAMTESLRYALRDTSKTDNIALRRMGGVCNGVATKLIAPFATDNHKKSVELLAEEKLSGRRTFGESIIEATGDFNDSKRFAGKKTG